MNNSVEIVLVLYKTSLLDSLTYQSFTKNIKNKSIEFELIIYNNSPEINIETDKSYFVVNSKANDMLSGAYNFALERALNKKWKWLLLFDQDTNITEEYIIEIEKFLNKKQVPDYVAIVPILFKEKLHLSPVSYSPRLGPFYFFKPISKVNPESNHCITAFNSATMLDVSFIESIGGFSEAYPLDMLDHWYFYQIYKEKRKVLILNSKLEQNLSLIDMDNSMNLTRYKGYLESLEQFAYELKFPTLLLLILKMFHLLLSQLFSSKRRKFFQTTITVMFGFLNFKKNKLST